MKNKEIMILVGALLVGILVGGTAIYLYTQVSSAPGEREIRIGVVGPMTGVVAEHGMRYMQAATLFMEQINENGGILIGGERYEIRMFFADTEARTERGITAMEKLITNSKISKNKQKYR